MTKEELMRKAIELSVKNVAEGGGPFGAVIAKNGYGSTPCDAGLRPDRPCRSKCHPCGS